jgi:cytoskeleton protein RodZ
MWSSTLDDESSMASVGSYLREHRRARGVSLKEMARATRVREQYLEALESDQFAGLPADVFTKGFIRACCHVLNEPAEEALRIYAEQVGLPPTPGEPARATTPGGRDNRGREPILVTLVLLVVLGVSLFGLTFALQSRQRTSAGSVSRATAVPPPAPPSAVPVEVAPPRPARTPPPAVAPNRTYRLVARVTETTWIRVKTEDGKVSEETMSPGDVREWVSNRRFVLTIGNAGGLALELNGRPLPALGPSGVVIPQLVIPPEQQ